MGIKCEVNLLQLELCEALGKAFKEMENIKHVRVRDVTDKELKQIKVLCHPDKHGGSKLAEEMFKKL